jgi:hypothetical protein
MGQGKSNSQGAGNSQYNGPGVSFLRHNILYAEIYFSRPHQVNP